MVDVLDRIHMSADGRVEYHYVLVDYLCTVLAGQLWPQSDATDARWVTRSELTALSVSGVALSVVDKAFSLASSRL